MYFAEERTPEHETTMRYLWGLLLIILVGILVVVGLKEGGFFATEHNSSFSGGLENVGQAK